MMRAYEAIFVYFTGMGGIWSLSETLLLERSFLRRSLSCGDQTQPTRFWCVSGATGDNSVKGPESFIYVSFVRVARLHQPKHWGSFRIKRIFKIIKD